MRTAFLSSSERERGVKAYLAHALYNGAGFTFLADTTVALMAVNLGASNTQLGFLGSVITLSGLAVPFVPVLFAGMNLSSVYFYTWLLRGLVCLFYLAIPFVAPSRGLTILLAVYTAFSLSRAFGAAMAGPVQRSLATSATLGGLVASLSVRFNVSALIARVISAAVLRIPQLGGLVGLLVLEVFGIVLNTLSALSLRKLGVRDRIERSGGLGVLDSFVENIRRTRVRQVLFLNWLALLCGIMFAFTVPFLKRIVLVSDSYVFIYTIAATLAAIAAGMVVTPVADRIGSGPIMVMGNVATALFAVAWAFAPATLNFWILVALGFATSFTMAAAGIMVSRLFVSSMPERDKVSYNAMFAFFAALVALAGGVGAGVLTDIGSHLAKGLLHPYSVSYLVAGALALASAGLAMGVKDEKGASLREAAGIVFSLRNLRDFLDLYQLDTTRDPVRRESVLAAIEQSDTDLATAEIGNRLKSPMTADRERALKSLFTHPREELLDDILSEALDTNSHIRTTAIFALGAYRLPRVETALRGMFDETDTMVQSSAAKSLARIGARDMVERVRWLAGREGLAPMARVNVAIALTIMDNSGEHLRRMYELACPEIGYRSSQAIFVTYARFLEIAPPIADFYHQENMDRGSGFAALLEEARAQGEFLEFEKAAGALYAKGDLRSVWSWCRALLAPRLRTLKGEPLAAAGAICDWDLQRLDDTNTIAALYFAYHVVRAPDGW